MTALHVLPRDVLARCLEFLPFDQALGEWADPELAAYFVFHLVERLPEPTGFEFVDFDDYWDWSANWWDRYKSSDFLSTAQEIIARESQWP